MTVSEQIREAIETCGATRYAIAKETGISESTLSRFFASGKGLSMPNVDRLCEFLGLVLVHGKTGKRRGEK